MAELEASRASLKAFAGQTDEEFTELAKGVGAMLARFRAVAEKTRLLDAILQDRDEDRALSRAYEVYKHSVDLVHASMGVALADHTQLEKVEARLLEACQAKASLGQNSLVFRMVTVETRIEAMRLEHEGQLIFTTVADAIQHMGQSINKTAEEAFGRIEEVVAETRGERARLQVHQVSLHEEAQRSVARIRAELDRLRDALLPCGEHSNGIVNLVSDVEGVANRVVMALQAQDIMRQQLEHVAGGFTEMEKGAADKDLLRQATRVQLFQLRAAKERMETATQTLTQALERLMEEGATLAQRFISMETAIVAAVGESKLAVLFREETEKLSQIANQSEQSNQRIAELVGRVDSVIKGFSHEVGDQQFDVTLVSLNAQIAAARMPNAGALNRLAEETSRVSARVGEMTSMITRQLREALESLRHMKEEADRFQAVIVHDKGDLETHSAEVNQLLESLQVRLQSESNEVSKEFAGVNETIRDFAGRVHWKDAIENSLGGAERLCQSLLEWCGPGQGGTAENPVYRAEQAGYTMESEYKLHAKAIGTSGAEEPASDKGKADSNDIELF